jgi:hypothetical protein
MTNRSAAFGTGVVCELLEFRGVGDYSWLSINRQPAQGNDKSVGRGSQFWHEAVIGNRGRRRG